LTPLPELPKLAVQPAAAASAAEDLAGPHRGGRPNAAAGRLVDAGRFGVVGLTGVLVNQIVLWVLVGALHLQYLLAAALSAQAAIAWNFTLTERWVFAGRRPGQLVTRVSAFTLVSNSTLLLQIPLLWLLTAVLGLHYLLSNALSVAVLSGLRFVLSDQVIWRARKAPEPRLSATSAPHAGTPPTVVFAVPSRVRARRQVAAVRGWAARPLRALLAVVVVAGAYHYSLRTLVAGLVGEAPLGYLGLVPFVGLLLVIGQATAVRPDADIHDRQVDYIMGLTLLGLAFVVLFVVRGRLAAQFWLWRIDLTSLPLFAAAVIVLLFGLRTLWRVRAGVVFLLLAWPPLGRRLTDLAAALPALHDSRSGAGVLASFAVVVIALTLLVRGRVAARLAWLTAGLLCELLIQVAARRGLGPGGLANRLDGPLAAAVLVALWSTKRWFGLHSPRWRAGATTVALPGRRSRVVPRPGFALPVVLVAALAAGAANTRLSSYRAVATDFGGVRLTAFSPAADRLPGWSTVRTASFPVVTTFLGPDASWDRYSYRPDHPLSKTSMQLVADVTSTSDVTALAGQPLGVIYGLREEPRQPQQVELSAGVTGRIEQLAPHNGQAGWTMVSWQWPVRTGNGQVRYERVTLLALPRFGGAAAGTLIGFARTLVQTRLATARQPHRSP
jgi:putative flippase GtrA